MEVVHTTPVHTSGCRGTGGGAGMGVCPLPVLMAMDSGLQGQRSPWATRAQGPPPPAAWFSFCMSAHPISMVSFADVHVHNALCLLRGGGQSSPTT